MATDRSFNPLPLLLHAVAIAAGVVLGLTAMAAISPDLPSEETDAGVQAPAETSQIAPDDPNSLLRQGPLTAALPAVDDQLEAGAHLTLVHITPAEISTEASTEAPGFDLSALDAAMPQRLAAFIARHTPGVGGLADVESIDLRADPSGEPHWFVQLNDDGHPTQYIAAPDI